MIQNLPSLTAIAFIVYTCDSLVLHRLFDYSQAIELLCGGESHRIGWSSFTVLSENLHRDCGDGPVTDCGYNEVICRNFMDSYARRAATQRNRISSAILLRVSINKAISLIYCFFLHSTRKLHMCILIEFAALGQIVEIIVIIMQCSDYFKSVAYFKYKAPLLEQFWISASLIVTIN